MEGGDGLKCFLSHEKARHQSLKEGNDTTFFHTYMLWSKIERGGMNAFIAPSKSYLNKLNTLCCSLRYIFLSEYNVESPSVR